MIQATKKNIAVGVVVCVVIIIIIVAVTSSQKPSGSQQPAQGQQQTQQPSISAPPGLLASSGPALVGLPGGQVYQAQYGTDLGGTDIACYTDGSDAAFCMTECDKDPSCRSIITVNPAKGGDWANGGCCYKTGNQATNADPMVNFYVKN